MSNNSPFKKSFDDIFNSQNQDPEDPEFEHYSLADEIDREIIMHREVHFGGKFSVMLGYYIAEGKGVHTEFEISRIEALEKMEKESGENLAPYLLTGPDAERIAQAKKAYEQLRKIYEQEEQKTPLPQLIADLILSEDEGAEEEVAALVSHQKTGIPHLLDLLRAEDFYDPLFPGYGRAPYLAARCLGRIGDEHVIGPLFEMLGAEHFFDEEEALLALKSIGEPSKEFLLKIINSRPIRPDTEKAAIALTVFNEDSRVADACFDLLKELDFKNHLELATYLILNCDSLSDQSKQEEFKSWLPDREIPEFVRPDMEALIKRWG